MSYAERLSFPKSENRAKYTPYWGEHAARYIWAIPYVKGKSVLDIACGTGYGCQILGKAASLVVGADADAESLRKAMEEYPEGKFVVANAEEMPFQNEEFDVVVSFETIEHLSDRKRFLSEVKRVLRTNGILILSTPNANYTKPINGIPKNPFHKYEYNPQELREELEAFFKVESLRGQTLHPKFAIPPFWEAQRRLPKDFSTQTRLLLWKLINKMPTNLRELISHIIWKRPFYPTEYDYEFREDTVETAPTLIVVCRKTA